MMRAALIALVLAGCASTSPKDALKDVNTHVAAQTGHDLRWDRNTKEDDDARKAIDRLLAADLTVDSAVQVALLASPKIRAKLEELAIGQADLVQAGLLSNPVFMIGTTAWEKEHIDPNLFVGVEQSFLDIITLPMKKRVASAELEGTKLDVAYEITELAADVREAFYRAQAAEQATALRSLVNEAAQTSAELARHQAAAGNMNDLTLNGHLALAAQTALDLRKAQTEAAVARTELDKYMGVWGPRTNWHLARRLPEPPANEPPLEHLESRAIAERLDIAAARRSVQAMESTLTLAKTTRWVGKVDVSVEAGRLRNTHHFAFGPSVALEIPLFDQRQGQIAKLEAIARRTDDELQALSIDVRADVRANRAKLVAARANVDDYTKTMIPLRENIVRFSQQQYDAMLLGVYQLLQAKQAEFEAYADSIMALRDYWIARSELERVIGFRLAR